MAILQSKIEWLNITIIQFVLDADFVINDVVLVVEVKFVLNFFFNLDSGVYIFPEILYPGVIKRA